MDQDHILSKLKKDVRSLLLSSKMGLDPDQLRKDYVAMLGHPMPLKILGFRNMVDMAKEMPDVVSVVFKGDGSIRLHAVSDALTQSIEELVAKQRTSLADKKRLQWRSGSFFPQSYRHNPAQVHLPRRGHRPLALPPLLRVQLSILLSQGPIRLSQLESTYQMCFGYPLRVHTYGFYSTAEMLDAASDMLLISQSRLGSLLSLRGQKLPTPHSPVTRATPRPAVKRPETPTDVLQRESVPALSGDCDPVRTLSDDPGSSSVPELVKNEPDAEASEQSFEDRILKLREEFCQHIQENGEAGTIRKDLKSKLQKLVALCPGGISVHELPAKYQMHYKEELPLPESGFVSVTELVAAMTDIFDLRPESGAGDSNSWIVTSIQDKSSNQTASDDVDVGLSSYFSSPWEGHREEEDKEEMTSLDPDKNDTITSSQPQQIICPAIQLHSCSAVPLDALQCERLKPPTLLKPPQLMAVLVEEIETPGNFYIRFSGTEETQAMEDMMIEMRRCYVCPEVSERYRLPQQFVRQGQVCCVSPKGLWFYRVVIHKVLSPSQLEVYFVDFGAVTVVQTCKLKFLKSCYSVLPAQAVPASLTGIKPTIGSWSRTATEHFKKLCSDCTLVGILDSYCGDVLLLYLCDTRNDEDVYIHSSLQQNGHAKACSRSASAKLCEQVTPISLYLGEGTLDQPEEPVISPVKGEDETEAPGLEYIGDSGISSPVQPDVQNGTLTCSELGFAVKDDLPESGPPTTPFTPTVPPDLIRDHQTPLSLSAADSDSTVSQPSLGSDTCSQSPPGVTTPSLVEAPSLLHTPGLRSPALGPTNMAFLGSPLSSSSPAQRRGFIFPVFGTR